MSNLVRIRPIAVSDLPDLAKLDKRVFGHLSYPYFVLRQIFDVHEGEILAAETDDEMVGYSIGIATSTGGLGWMLAIGVDPRYRSQGIGAELLDHSIRLLRGQRIDRLRLTVDKRNSTAVGLYNKIGFRIVDEIDDYLGPNEPRLLLELDLPRS